MNFFVISDIHGAFGDLKKVLEIFEAERGDILVICGDFLNPGPRNDFGAINRYDTFSIAKALNDLKDKIICVRGNCDSEVDQMMFDFPMTNPTTTFWLSESGGKLRRVFLHHGHILGGQIADSETERDKKENALRSLAGNGSIIISGHTHIPVLKKDGGCYYLNPGSISLPKKNLANGNIQTEKSFAIIETNDVATKIEIRTLKNNTVTNTLEIGD